MLHFRTFRNFPEVFDDRRERRYLTPGEAEELAGIKGPATRAPWLLVRLTAKGLIQRYLSERFDLWIPENSIGVRGTLPRDAQCVRLHVEPDGPYESRALPDLAVRAVVGEMGVLCAVEPATHGKRFSLAVQSIDAGFPFFMDEPLAEEEVNRLADVEEEYRNGHVAASLAVKRAVIGALTLEKAQNLDESEFIVGPVEYGRAVRVDAPEDRLGRRRIFAWVDVVPPLAVAYAAVLDPDFQDEPALLSECDWIVDPRKNGRNPTL